MPIASSWSGLLAITIHLVSPFKTHLLKFCCASAQPPLVASSSTQLQRKAAAALRKAPITRPPNRRSNFINLSIGGKPPVEAVCHRLWQRRDFSNRRRGFRKTDGDSRRSVTSNRIRRMACPKLKNRCSTASVNTDRLSILTGRIPEAE